MARPRIFISSTFYDLRHVRADLERFVKDLGYDSILNERGNIPYGKEEKLEEYCYKEISSIDILVALVGNRFGSESQHDGYSVSQMEIKTALELNKQVYLFINKDVYAEYQTYKINIENETIQYRFVDSKKVYEFIREVELLQHNNTIQTFETAYEIMDYLREQWAGLFQRLLQEQTRFQEINLLQGMKATVNTLYQLVNFLTTERKDRDQAIKDILISSHPAMEQIRELMKLKFRVFFTTKDELNGLLETFGFREIVFADDNSYDWVRTGRDNTRTYYVTVNKSVFNPDGTLIPYTKVEWDKNYIQYTIQDDDDLPF